MSAAVLLVAILFGALGGDEIRANLVAAYARSEQCARYKFLDGMLANRAAGFELFGPDGHSRDLSLERERFQLLFSRATRVRFKTRILKIVPRARGAQAEVSQSLVVEQVEPRTRSLYCQVYSTREIDTWEVTPWGWKLTSSTVLHQQSSRTGPLKLNQR